MKRQPLTHQVKAADLALSLSIEVRVIQARLKEIKKQVQPIRKVLNSEACPLIRAANQACRVWWDVNTMLDALRSK